MNKSEIVAIVADRVNLSRKDAEVAVDTFLESICDALAQGDKVVISGFGTF